jgi:hypothetical protein
MHPPQITISINFNKLNLAATQNSLLANVAQRLPTKIKHEFKVQEERCKGVYHGGCNCGGKTHQMMESRNCRLRRWYDGV